MALLFTGTPALCFPSSLSTSSSSSLAINAIPLSFSRKLKGSIGPYPKSFNGLQIHTPFYPKERGLMVVKASSDIDGTGPDSADPPLESEDEDGPIENLPLESKLQLKLEQKMRMKLAKKIRLRRKKLVRKRRLRKKGRWPPSKMKKNKNV
ncbi:hypothetical protein NMG60_11025671 [Bertholletia excelsa]